MVAGEYGDVSTFLQWLDDDLDIKPYHYSVTLNNTGLESASYGMTQKTMRILSSQKCTKRICASLLHVIVEKLAQHAFVLLCFSQFPRYVAYNLPEQKDLPLEIVSWVLQMFGVEVPDNVVALWVLVASASALLPADLLMRADVDLSVVHLNMDAATNGKAMSEKVGAQMQEVDSWKRLDFKIIAEKFACGEPLRCESSDDDAEDDEPGICDSV